MSTPVKAVKAVKAVTETATAKAKPAPAKTASVAKPKRITKTSQTAKMIDAAVSKAGGNSNDLNRGKLLEKMETELGMTEGQASTYYHNHLRENYTAKGTLRKTAVK